MSTITKEKMMQVLRLNSVDFNDFLMSLEDSVTVESLLVKVMDNETQRSNERRIKRIHSRFNKLRAQEEREMIQRREWYDLI